MMDALVKSNKSFMLMEKKKKALSEMFFTDLMNITSHVRVFLTHEQPQTADGPVGLPVSLCQASDDATPPAQEHSENLVFGSQYGCPQLTPLPGL